MTRYRLRFLVPLFLAMPLVLPTGACAAVGSSQGGQNVLTDADSGATKTVALGHSVEVRLPAQLGTGFSWSAVPTDGVEVGAPATTGGKGIPGGVETQVFKVKLTAAGSHTLTFNYSQGWAGGEKNAKTVTYTIIGS